MACSSSAIPREATVKYYSYGTFIISRLSKGSGTEDKSLAKVGKLDHRPVAKDTGYFV